MDGIPTTGGSGSTARVQAEYGEVATFEQQDVNYVVPLATPPPPLVPIGSSAACCACASLAAAAVASPLTAADAHAAKTTLAPAVS